MCARMKRIQKTCDVCGSIVEVDEICGVCGWHDDDVCADHPEKAIGPNPISLNEAWTRWKAGWKNVFGEEDPRDQD